MHSIFSNKQQAASSKEAASYSVAARFLLQLEVA